MVTHILVTGASGFLGRNLTASLHVKHPEWQISTLDLVAPTIEQKAYIYQHFQVDITSRKAVQRVFEGGEGDSDSSNEYNEDGYKDGDNQKATRGRYRPNLIVHCAGIVPARARRYSTKTSDWERVKAVNYDGTKNVVDAAVQAGCTRFVLTSSCTVVFDDLDHDYPNVDETAPTGLATLHYGKSKGMAEQYVLNKTRIGEAKFRACALRPCTIIGEGDIAVIGVLHDLIGKGETGFIVGNGKNLFDFMHIDNAVLAHVLAVENMLGEATANGHAFFISNQEPVYFWEFLAIVWAHFGHVPARRYKIPVFLAWMMGLVLEYVTWWMGTQPTLNRGSVKDGFRTRYSNNAKAIDILGYRPIVPLSEGILRACEDYKLYLETERLRSMELAAEKPPT